MTINQTDPVFISYRHSDGFDICAELAWILRAAGLPVWRDRDDLPPGDTEQRLDQALGDGLSGAVLIITPDVEKSEVVQHVESPRLIELHQQHPEFTLGIVNAVEREPGKIDYTAPERVLLKRQGTLSGVDQTEVSRGGMVGLAKGMVLQRVANRRARGIYEDTPFTISVQTRNTPQVYDRTGADLDIRLQPGSDERLPSPNGLRDLADTVGNLPTAATRAAAQRVRIEGGAHLAVAFALGAALPETRVGYIDVTDTFGCTWSSDAGNSEALVSAESDWTNQTPPAGRRTVAVYVDLTAPRSDAAFRRYLDEHGSGLAAWAHVVPTQEGRLDPSDAGALAREVADHMRELSAKHDNADVHVLLHCPFGVAVLVGRLTNTLRMTAFEWAPADPADGDHRPRYVPVVDLVTTAPAGVITKVY
ncbi:MULTISPECIES: SAVED domain-containing protein [unclassified Nocardioides]|uniref:SAVED domain-containing protein n=1 Tax=unclassified Nocardioides TaxID=2615069 RepID=UPI0006FBA152|nr:MULTISPECIES: SAVED domain-containing protein [unclassified Nocardioides]KRA30975.1 hypothetical protein ASD81_15865 [Nocardioides sp. Root614]KRA87596.1 hypothetical protein ASD84_16140 [Nocardioides sp. Root682]